jgi:hypothetical protein
LDCGEAAKSQRILAAVAADLEESRARAGKAGGRGKKKRAAVAQLAAEAAAALAQAAVFGGGTRDVIKTSAGFETPAAEVAAAIERAARLQHLAVTPAPLRWYVWAADILKSVLKRNEHAADILESGLRAHAAVGFPRGALSAPPVAPLAPLAPLRGLLGSSPDRESAMGNAPALHVVRARICAGL